MVLAQPTAAGERLDQGAIKTARGAVVEIFQTGGLAQPREAQTLGERGVVAFDRLAINQHRQALVEAEAIAIGQTLLFLERLGHAGQTQAAQRRDRRMDHHSLGCRCCWMGSRSHLIAAEPARRRDGGNVVEVELDDCFQCCTGGAVAGGFGERLYICQENTVRRGGRVCQSVPGKIVDPAIGALLVELMTPMALEVTLAVQQELEARAAETDASRRQHVERMRYEAELARRRYMKVDPDNRLVADALEAEWNGKLRSYSEAVEDYERRSRDQPAALDTQARRRILDLAERFAAVWQDPRVEPRERKRILRLLIEDVTLIKGETITAHVRLRGGATRTLVLDRPLPIAQIRKFKPEIVAEVNRLLDQYCDREIAEILNQRASRTWEGKPFNLKKIAFIRQAYKLRSRYERLRLRGMLTTREVAARFEVSEAAVHDWGRQGLIRKCYSDSLTRGLWEIPAGQTILKGCGGRGARPAQLIPITALQPERGAV